MNRTLPIILAAVLLFFLACASTQVSKVDSLEMVPSEFVSTQSGNGPIDERWWLSFGDEQLASYVEEAVAENPSVAQALAQTEQARAVARISQSDLFPELGAGLSANRRGGAGNAENSDSVGFSLDISWELDLWGRLSALNAAAREEFFASQSNARAVRQAVAGQTTRTYFAVIEAEQQIALSRSVLESYAELSRQLDLRVSAGISPISLKMLVTTDEQSARGGLEARLEDYKRLVRRLEILLRDYPDGEIELAGSLPPLPPVPAVGVPAELLARRPDVAAAEMQLLATGYRVDAARRSFLPNLFLNGSAGTSGADFANLFDADVFVWSIAGQLLQPIFQGGRLRAQLDQRQGEQDEALERYAEVALRALFEVETALAIDSNLAAREVAFLVAADAAEKSLEISTKRYRAGIEPFFNVLETQQRALDARSAYLSTRRDRLFNRVDLHLAVGGGFAEMKDLSLQDESLSIN